MLFCCLHLGCLRLLRFACNNAELLVWVCSLIVICARVICLNGTCCCVLCWCCFKGVCLDVWFALFYCLVGLLFMVGCLLICFCCLVVL